MLFVLLGLGLFLIGAMAFAIDMSNLWFNRQAAQTAADAACTAGAMDMLVDYTNGTTNQGGFSVSGTPTAVDCSTSQTPAPCQYATLNGFDSAISTSNANSGTLGNNVAFQVSSTAPPGLLPGSIPSSTVAANAFLSVKITDNIPTFFAGMLRGTTKQNIGATAICGVIEATSPIPILVLNPTLTKAFSVQGTPNVTIVGGPNKSIQVNSSFVGNAANVGGAATVNLCAGGGNYCGSSMGVWGTESTPGGFFSTASSCTGNRPPGAPACTATQQAPQWNSPSAPIADPLAGITAPAQPTNVPGAPAVIPAGSTTNGCPDPGGCYEYQPGYYPTGICVGKGGCSFKTYTTAIFQPGIYYIVGGMSASSLSCLRPSTAAGDGSGGTIFYFADANSISVGSNTGGCGVTAFNILTGTGSLANGVKCTAASQIPSNLVTQATLDGSVLLAPCRVPPTVNALCAPNCSLNFGDPLGPADTIGEQRGILFFQNRAKNAGTNPNWGGGGAMLLAGTMYFHQCVTSGSDTGQGCAGAAFNDQVSLGGGSGSTTYVLGDVISDQLNLHGNSGITMDLNPSATLNTLKASLLQ
jgi:hypothetical protein